MLILGKITHTLPITVADMIAAPTAPASIGFHTEWKNIARRLDAMKESTRLMSWISSVTILFLLSGVGIAALADDLEVGG